MPCPVPSARARGSPLGHRNGDGSLRGPGSLREAVPSTETGWLNGVPGRDGLGQPRRWALLAPAVLVGPRASAGAASHQAVESGTGLRTEAASGLGNPVGRICPVLQRGDLNGTSPPPPRFAKPEGPPDTVKFPCRSTR